MSDDHRATAAMRLGGIEVVAPSLGSSGPAGNGANGGDSDILNGSAAKSDETAASVAPADAETAVTDRGRVLRGILQDLREQVADFADFAHRGRVNLPDRQVLGSGGGVTAQVVRAIAAEAVQARLIPALNVDEQTLCDLLMLALVSPGDPAELTKSQRESFMHSRGQLMLDVSTAEAGPRRPVTRLVAPPAPPRPEQAAANGNGSAGGGGDSPPPAAAVIVGAGAIAERPFLGLDSVLSHARRAVFRKVSPSRQGQSAGDGMRAARNLEIVVLLEAALGGGLWIDIDPATSLPTAALAIALPAPPDRIRFTHVLLPRAGEAGMLLAARAS